MNFDEYARRELDILVPPDKKDDIDVEFDNDIIDVVRLISEQGHSGMTIGRLRAILRRILALKPLTPLTGDDDEWTPAFDGGDGKRIQQNIRCYSVFREEGDNATAYDVAARVYSDDGKTWYSDNMSSVYVTFPYYPPDEPERVVFKKDERCWVL